MNAIDAMILESKRVGWPVSHTDDLHVHDRKRLESDDAPLSFVWVLRELGTELLDTRMDVSSARAYLNHYRMCEGDGLRFYVWDDGSLRPITLEAADAWLIGRAENLGYNGY